MEVRESPRGRRLLWAVPVVVAVQHLIVALLVAADGGPLVFPLYLLITVPLTWAAAERRSEGAWLTLLALAVITLGVGLLTGLAGDYQPATFAALPLSGVVVGLLVWPDTLDYLRS